MAKPNAVGWFDIYVNDMKRAIAFYEAVLKQKLEKIDTKLANSTIPNFTMVSIDTLRNQIIAGSGRSAPAACSAQSRTAGGSRPQAARCERETKINQIMPESASSTGSRPASRSTSPAASRRQLRSGDRW